MQSLPVYFIIQPMNANLAYSYSFVTSEKYSKMFLVLLPFRGLDIYLGQALVDSNSTPNLK